MVKELKLNVPDRTVADVLGVDVLIVGIAVAYAYDSYVAY